MLERRRRPLKTLWETRYSTHSSNPAKRVRAWAHTGRERSVRSEQAEHKSDLTCPSNYPPAIAPTTINTSLPSATGFGSSRSGEQCDRSWSHAKNRTNGRRFLLA
jgi:hypothetical protein